jgi:hypothetical protein
MSESDGQEASLSGSSLHSGSKNNSSHEDGSGPSISGSSTGSTRGATKKEEEIARSEDRAVTYSRVLVLGVLLVSATVAGVVTWIYGTEAEEENFHSQVRTACSFSRKQVWPSNMNWSSLLLMFYYTSV